MNRISYNSDSDIDVIIQLTSHNYSLSETYTYCTTAENNIRLTKNTMSLMFLTEIFETLFLVLDYPVIVLIEQQRIK